MRFGLLVFFFCLFLSFTSFGQSKSVTISGLLKDKKTKASISFANVVIKAATDSSFVTGAISNEEGRFTITQVKPGNYYIEFFFVGYATGIQALYVGSLSDFLDIGVMELEVDAKLLGEVVITEKQDEVSGKMDKKTFSVEDNISQGGGSVLQAMQNLPGVAVQEGKIQLRGSDRVTVLIDGKQTALTGFGNQSGLDNIPASAIERIEIINNPSSKYDANGNAGIINIIMKKNKQNGFSGKAGLTAGLGALWIKKENLPEIRPQYMNTPKINPSVSLNYRKKKVNFFLQLDNLYTQTLNKNEFVTRTYDSGMVIKQQLKRNRNTNFFTSKAGFDWSMNERNTLTISGMFATESIIDRGDQPFFNEDLSYRYRLWQFLEDELKTTVMATAAYRHKFAGEGHLLNIGFNYTFHREDEKYFFDNTMPTFAGKDAFALISDEQVADLNLDYIKPLRYGRMEAGMKLRKRDIPTNMQFYPGLNSPIDSGAGGPATYREIIPALYFNYIIENKYMEAEAGLRGEYVDLNYEVNPDHKIYKSDGYSYAQPFPNVRLAAKINEKNRISLFYNRRVDRPNEVDIRIFPKYDDAEIIKVGNPALQPQFTNSFEVGYKTSWNAGYFYMAAYHRVTDGTITRISTIVPGSTLIYAVFQNAGRSYNTGSEIVFNHNFGKVYSFNLNLNAYQNSIEAFTVENKYPVSTLHTSVAQEMISGNAKMNHIFHFPKNFDVQLTAIYLAPDIIPQGKIDQRFSLDLGIKKAIGKKGELFFNASDLLNTMIIRKEVKGNGFRYTSADYYETQVLRVGYNYKF